MERIARDPAQSGIGIVDHVRAMGIGNHGLAGSAYGQRLAPARVAGVLVRLDNAGGDEQISLIRYPVHR